MMRPVEQANRAQNRTGTGRMMRPITEDRRADGCLTAADGQKTRQPSPAATGLPLT
jgi:hypothetical protein